MKKVEFIEKKYDNINIMVNINKSFEESEELIRQKKRYSAMLRWFILNEEEHHSGLKRDINFDLLSQFKEEVDKDIEKKGKMQKWLKWYDSIFDKKEISEEDLDKKGLITYNNPFLKDNILWGINDILLDRYDFIKILPEYFIIENDMVKIRIKKYDIKNIITLYNLRKYGWLSDDKLYMKELKKYNADTEFKNEFWVNRYMCANGFLYTKVGAVGGKAVYDLEPGTDDGRGYDAVSGVGKRLDGKMMEKRLHRLCFVCFNKDIEYSDVYNGDIEVDIDHKDHNLRNNKITNLRAMSRLDNLRKKKPIFKKESGIKIYVIENDILKPLYFINGDNKEEKDHFLKAYKDVSMNIIKKRKKMMVKSHKGFYFCFENDYIYDILERYKDGLSIDKVCDILCDKEGVEDTYKSVDDKGNISFDVNAMIYGDKY